MRLRWSSPPTVGPRTILICPSFLGCFFGHAGLLMVASVRIRGADVANSGGPASVLSILSGRQLGELRFCVCRLAWKRKRSGFGQNARTSAPRWIDCVRGQAVLASPSISLRRLPTNLTWCLQLRVISGGKIGPSTGSSPTAGPRLQALRLNAGRPKGGAAR